MKTGENLPITNLAVLRSDLDMTQSEMAAALECDIKTYRSYEKGTACPGGKMLKNMQSFFCKKGIPVSTDYILGLSDFRSPEKDFIGSSTGLSDAAIDCLHAWNESRQSNGFNKDFLNSNSNDIDTLNTILEYYGKDIDTLNTILEYYRKGKELGTIARALALPSFSLFHFIGNFWDSQKFKAASKIEFINSDGFYELSPVDATSLFRESCKNQVIDELKKIGGNE